MVEQLEKEYGKESEAMLETGTFPSEEEIFHTLSFTEPLILEQYNWWDLDQEQIEYVYHKMLAGRTLPDGRRRRSIPMFVFILKEIEGQHLVYIVY